MEPLPSWEPASSPLGPLTLRFWPMSPSSLPGWHPGWAQGTCPCGFAMTASSWKSAQSSGRCRPPPQIPRPRKPCTPALFRLQQGMLCNLCVATLGCRSPLSSDWTAMMPFLPLW